MLFSRQRRQTAMRCSYYYLPCFRACYIACRKNTGDISLHKTVGHDTSFFGHLYCTLQEIDYRLVAHEIDKDPVERQFVLDSGCLYPYTLNGIAAFDGCYLSAEEKFDIRNLQSRIIFFDLQFLRWRDKIDRLGKPRENAGLLGGFFGVAQNTDGFTLEESGIADGAVADSAAQEFFLAPD